MLIYDREQEYIHTLEQFFSYDCNVHTILQEMSKVYSLQ